MNLLDYFELPADYDPKSWSLTIWAACSLPGLHEVPQLGRWGVPVTIDRAR